MSRNLALAVVFLCGCTQAYAQQINQLQCRGVMGNTSAVLSGVRQYAPYNAMGDGYVKFDGKVTAGGILGRVSYEGYTRSGAVEAVILTSQGTLRIGVLDNTGGRMLIYEGAPRLGAPQTIGRFTCHWR